MRGRRVEQARAVLTQLQLMGWCLEEHEDWSDDLRLFKALGVDDPYVGALVAAMACYERDKGAAVPAMATDVPGVVLGVYRMEILCECQICQRAVRTMGKKT